MFHEWEKYRVDRTVANAHVPFDTVWHICHISDAKRIIEDKYIRSSLVWDESKLKNTRTCVSWVSPNDWIWGSIYGNVSFEYNWKTLVENKKFYWVEDLLKYNPPAYRILVTGNDCHSSELVEYDYLKPHGPIYYENGTWYRNGNHTGEFLIEADLLLPECVQIKFVKHHPNICTKSGRNCEDINMSREKSAQYLLSYCMANDIKYVNEKFMRDKNKRTLDSEILYALSWLYFGLENHFNPSSYSFTYSENINILKSVLLAKSLRRDDLALSLFNLFNSKDAVKELYEQEIIKHFEIDKKEQTDWGNFF
jgi:hypothetical protein